MGFIRATTTEIGVKSLAASAGVNHIGADEKSGVGLSVCCVTRKHEIGATAEYAKTSDKDRTVRLDGNSPCLVIAAKVTGPPSVVIAEKQVRRSIRQIARQRKVESSGRSSSVAGSRKHDTSIRLKSNTVRAIK